MYLIPLEKELTLVVGRPYNSVFSNRGAEGFSIAVRQKIGTLFSSGELFKVVRPASLRIKGKKGI
jgi:hypothetical protein